MTRDCNNFSVIYVKLFRILLGSGSDGDFIISRAEEQPVFTVKYHVDPTSWTTKILDHPMESRG